MSKISLRCLSYQLWKSQVAASCCNLFWNYGFSNLRCHATFSAHTFAVLHLISWEAQRIFCIRWSTDRAQKVGLEQIEMLVPCTVGLTRLVTAFGSPKATATVDLILADNENYLASFCKVITRKNWLLLKVIIWFTIVCLLAWSWQCVAVSQLP